MPHINYQSKLVGLELLESRQKSLASAIALAAKRAGATETSSVRSDYSFRFLLAAVNLDGNARLIKTFILPDSQHNRSPNGETRLVFFERNVSVQREWRTKYVPQLFVAVFNFNPRKKSDYKNVRIMDAGVFSGMVSRTAATTRLLLVPFDTVGFSPIVLTEPALESREPGKSDRKLRERLGAAKL